MYIITINPTGSNEIVLGKWDHEYAALRTEESLKNAGIKNITVGRVTEVQLIEGEALPTRWHRV